jgi:uncharacterized coiled-coil protein SlyX
MSDTDRIHELEVKIAFLEKHVVEQDRAMLEMSDRLAAIEKRLQSLRDRFERGPENPMPADEKPPHY